MTAGDACMYTGMFKVHVLTRCAFALTHTHTQEAGTGATSSLCCCLFLFDVAEASEETCSLFSL